MAQGTKLGDAQGVITSVDVKRNFVEQADGSFKNDNSVILGSFVGGQATADARITLKMNVRMYFKNGSGMLQHHNMKTSYSFDALDLAVAGIRELADIKTLVGTECTMSGVVLIEPGQEFPWKDKNGNAIINEDTTLKDGRIIPAVDHYHTDKLEVTGVVSNVHRAFVESADQSAVQARMVAEVKSVAEATTEAPKADKKAAKTEA